MKTNGLVVFALCTLIQGAFGAVEFSVEGVAGVRVYGATNELTSESKKTFEARFAGQRWSIYTKVKESIIFDEQLRRHHEAMEERGRKRTGFGSKDVSYEVVFDSRDIFSVTILGDRGALIDATVRPGPIPYNDHSSLSFPIWLAYGSGIYFKTNTSGKVHATWCLEQVEPIWYAGVLFPGEWRLSDRLPHVPISLRVFDLGNYFSIQGEGLRKHIETNTYNPPFERGFLRSAYTVITTTNIAGVELPVEFELKIYAPRMDATTQADVRSFYTYYGRAMSFRVESMPEIALPSLPANQRLEIFDNRFRVEDPFAVISYSKTNGNWPSRDDAQARSVYANFRLNAADARRVTSLARRAVVYVLFATAVLIPALIGFAWKRSKHSTTTTSKVC